MFTSFAQALSIFALLQQPPCQPGQVIEVGHGRDYTVTICGVGLIGLRGVEPPLRVAGSFPPMAGPVSGEILGGKNIGPQAVEFLNTLLLGKRVMLVYDGWRISDPPERQYAYVFLPNKTLVNAELIRRGFGYADLQGSHPRRDEFRALETTARRARVGLWS